MSWYIVEGPDDTGKTTLTRGLERRGWTYEHATASDRLPLLAQRMAAQQDHENVAWDRAHLGELVHNRLDRKIVTPEGWRRLIEAFLLSRNSVNVLLTIRYQRSDDPYENSQARQDELASAFYTAANDSFLYWQRTWPDPIPWPWSYPNEADLTWSLDRVDPEGLGSLTPVAWVLGQQQNPFADVPWPFATRCGIELVWPTVDPRNFRVSNAAPSSWRGPAIFTKTKRKILPLERNHLNAFQDLHERWLALNQPRVIALGKKTVFYCEMADVPVWRRLPHPQYWLRFHVQEQNRYQFWLQRAMLEAEREALQAIPFYEP